MYDEYYDQEYYDDDYDNVHKHCFNCYNMKCTVIPDGETSCKMVSCDIIGCPAKIHECKLQDHYAVCMHVTVNCVNFKYGCRKKLKRSEQSAHLITCSASVVCCSFKWYRTDLESQHKNIKFEAPKESYAPNCGQLDVALAFRDQRLLNESLKSVRKKRFSKTSGSNVSGKASDVEGPTCTHASEKCIKVDDKKLDENCGSNDDQVMGENESVNEDSGQENNRTSGLIFMPSDSEEEWEIDDDYFTMEYESDEEYKPVVWQFRLLTPFLQLDQAENKAAELVSNSDRLTVTLQSPKSDVIVSQLDAGNGNVIFNFPNGDIALPEALEENKLQHNFNHQLKDHTESSNPNTTDHTHHTVNTHTSKPSSFLKPKKGYFILENENSKSSPVNPAEVNDADILQKEDLQYHDILSIDLPIEKSPQATVKPWIGRYHVSCNQSFRRDQFVSHVKNVHYDIHEGLNGMLEQRCPLANRGCTFICHKLQPKSENNFIVHSSLLESFGLQHKDKDTKDPRLRNFVNCKNTSKSLESSQDHTSMTAESAVDKSAYSNHPSVPCNKSNKDVSLLQNSSENCQLNSKLHNMTITSTLPTQGSTTPAIASNIKGSETTVSDVALSPAHLPGSPTATISPPCSSELERSSPSTSKLKPSVPSDTPSSRTLPGSAKFTIYTGLNMDSSVEIKYEEVSDNTYDKLFKLFDLPVEVIEKIVNQLDSFSLCNVARTCHLLRAICCNILDERGMVTQIWGKWFKRRKHYKVFHQADIKWFVKYYRRAFSTAFSPIENWKYTDHPSISNHLKVCPFNQDKVEWKNKFLIFPPAKPEDEDYKGIEDRMRDKEGIKGRVKNKEGSVDKSKDKGVKPMTKLEMEKILKEGLNRLETVEEI